jgi:hypothetical protein
MQNTYLISEGKLKAFTDINNALDTDLIKSAIREAQIIQITRLLGQKLYDKIVNDVANNTITGVYKTLLDDYIQDVLIYYAYYVALEYIYLRPRNNGLLQPQGGDNALAVDMQMYDKKRQSVINKAEYFAERLVDYLCFHDKDYPEYGTEKNEEIVPDKGIQFSSPFVFRKTVRDDIEKMGIKITNSRYKYLPQ